MPGGQADGHRVTGFESRGEQPGRGGAGHRTGAARSQRPFDGAEEIPVVAEGVVHQQVGQALGHVTPVVRSCIYI